LKTNWNKKTRREIIDIFGSFFADLGINIDVCTKKELLAVLNYRCKHSHSAFEHPSCYKKESKIVEKVCCLDIETSNLHADFGVILSWCIKSLDNKKLFVDTITLDDIHKNKYDSRVVESCVKNLKEFDRVVGQFSTYFDIPFIRTRAEHWKIDFPKYGDIYHTDIWKIAKRKLRLHSNRQGSIAETILGQNIKTRIHPKIWLQMQFGSDKVREDAIEYITKHNKKDVIQLEALYKRLRKYVREGRTSI